MTSDAPLCVAPRQWLALAAVGRGSLLLKYNQKTRILIRGNHEIWIQTL